MSEQNEADCLNCYGDGKVPKLGDKIPGALPSFVWVTCPVCNGTGKVRGRDGDAIDRVADRRDAPPNEGDPLRLARGRSEVAGRYRR